MVCFVIGRTATAIKRNPTTQVSITVGTLANTLIIYKCHQRKVNLFLICVTAVNYSGRRSKFMTRCNVLALILIKLHTYLLSSLRCHLESDPLRAVVMNVKDIVGNVRTIHPESRRNFHVHSELE